jgi:hypothetical protein
MTNTDLSLKCSALGSPPPFIVWKVDEVEISNTHRVRIHSFTKTDGMGTVSYLNISSIRMQARVKHSFLYISASFLAKRRYCQSRDQ